MAAGRRGRPYHVPHDATPVNGPTVDVESRVGWLLLMSRLHHRNPELALGGSFNEALRAAGLQTDRSAVSRWESGKVTPRYSVLVAYEQALGLRAGQLTSVVNAQRRAFGSGANQAAWMPILDASSDGFQRRLDSLFDGLLDGPGTGPEWTAPWSASCCAMACAASSARRPMPRSPRSSPGRSRGRAGGICARCPR